MVVAVTATAQYWADSFQERKRSSLGTRKYAPPPPNFFLKGQRIKAGFAIKKGGSQLHAATFFVKVLLIAADYSSYSAVSTLIVARQVQVTAAGGGPQLLPVTRRK